jgi:hypothetical protein
MGNCNFCSQQSTEQHPQNELISSREEANEDLQKVNLSYNNIKDATSRSMEVDPINSDIEGKAKTENLKRISLADIRTQPIEEEYDDFEFDDRTYSLDVFRFYNSFRTNPIDYINELFTEKYIDVKQISYCDKVIDDMLYKSNSKGNFSTNFLDKLNSSSNMDTSKNKGTILNSNNSYTSKVVWSNKLFFILSDYLHEAERGKKFDTNYVEEKIKEGFGDGCFVYISTLRIDRKIPPNETFNLILKDKIERKNFFQFMNNEISFGAVCTIHYKETFYDTILCLLII